MVLKIRDEWTVQAVVCPYMGNAVAFDDADSILCSYPQATSRVGMQGIDLIAR